MTQPQSGAPADQPKKRTPSLGDFVAWLGIDGGVFGAIKTITEEGSNLLVYLCWVFAFTLILYISIWPIIYLVVALEGSSAEKWIDDLPENVLIFIIVLSTTAVMAVVAFGWLRVQDTNFAEKSLGFQLVFGFLGFAVLLGTYLGWRSLKDD